MSTKFSLESCSPLGKDIFDKQKHSIQYFCRGEHWIKHTTNIQDSDVNPTWEMNNINVKWRVLHAENGLGGSNTIFVTEEKKMKEALNSRSMKISKN